ncbi:endonuclease/exonuclease/phosphatase family protein [Daldinia caldariorum]|uniref:endonuclease/exonuclease/phosphatase family protein n=1 Tax=Daldinia caldariorum TaxID=326644 RepID=UPI0020086FEF|nr:endonuclease/exonuclease/phosphatase family protein [Daldinia caldariorum]KAI1471567.1 endonuclease/exonuclease/phosphatase family protein [Daldinia caldariorum]
MKTTTSFLRWLVAPLLVATSVSGESIAQINGDHFLSPLNGQTVTNVTGIVTAKGPDGIWLRSIKPSRNKRVSDGLYTYGSVLAKNASISVGDVLVVDGKVSEYRTSKDYLYMTELTSPKVRAILERGRKVEPLVIGKGGLKPPTKQYSGLDNGDVFAVPNNQSLVSVENPLLEPGLYGLDFWESLMGELVTIESPRAVGRPNKYGDTWIVGDWDTTGDNNRAGLTVSAADGNPEAILIGSPLDGTKNPQDTKLGDKLDAITGVVYQAFGFYRILPLTNISVVESLAPATAPPTSLVSEGTCQGVTMGSYNVENLYGGDAAHVQAVARHVVQYMRTPDLLAVQEIQDDSGETDDGTVGADETLAALAAAIRSFGNGNGNGNGNNNNTAAAGGVAYNYTYISPLNDESGGAPGGNIRVAYLYRTDRLRLRNPNPGNATTANEVLPGPELKYNPGFVDPSNAAWTNSRKPLAAAWELVGSGSNNSSSSKASKASKASKTLFTVNVHWGSKGGSSSLHGDARPPVNGGVEARLAQAEATATFVASILSEDPAAAVVALGDFNEFAFAAPVASFGSRSGLADLDEAAGVPPAERYTYLYDMNAQELDHVFVSPALARAQRTRFEHVHANTWAAYADMTSDHDPSVARFDIC